MLPLSNNTVAVMNRLFPGEVGDTVRRLLIERCGNKLPGCEYADSCELERIRFAVLKISLGDPERLAGAVALANADWRDLLMEAGFGHDLKAHETWAAEMIR